LIYTAVTRGKRLVVLVGTKKALVMAVRRQDTDKRYTVLRRRLEGTGGWGLWRRVPKGILEPLARPIRGVAREGLLAKAQRG
jgi:hypothetical protein